VKKSLPLLFVLVTLWSFAAAAELPRERVSKAAALADVNQFFRTLKRVHPNLLRNVSEESYRKLSYSMAAGFAAMFRDYKMGTIVGYESGGLPITFGGPHRFILKNSRIPCSVAWTQIYPPTPRPGDDEHGVIPEVPLSEQNLADFKTEQDPALAFTLRYIGSALAPRAAPQR
jgi:hypothetical protein